MKRSRTERLARALVTSLLALGCGSTAAPRAVTTAAPRAVTPAAATVPSARLRDRPRNEEELPVTSASIFFPNLDGSVLAAEKIVAARPDLLAGHKALAGLLYQRGKYRGDLDEMQRAIVELGHCLRIDPKNAHILLMRASQEQSLHRFADAQADLARAKELGLGRDDTSALEQELAWNAGRYEEAIGAIRSTAAKSRTMLTVVRLAQLEHDLGNIEAADRAFEEAEDLFDDTSPLALGWLNVQRGMHELSLGRLERSVTFFREAVKRAPGYVLAKEHLAEALHLHGGDDESIALYEVIVRESSDPEFLGALAGLYRTHGRAAEADQLQRRATVGYEDLLRRYPEAMYWHAAEFYMEEGRDPRKALDLLRKNLALRPNAQSEVALARALLANGEVEEASSAIARALATPVVSAPLFWTAARVSALRGDVTRSRAYADRARTYQPNIASIEPAIERVP